MAQCRHFLPSPFPVPPSAPSLRFVPGAFTVFFPELGWLAGDATISGSDDEVVGERTRRREAQLHGAARERLLRALAGTETSGWKIGLLLLGAAALLLLLVLTPLQSAGWKFLVSDDSSGRAFMPDISWSFCKSSLEKDSSTKFDSHSSSAKSSYYFKNEERND